MLRIENRNQLRGRIIGAMIMAGFGALWLLLALYINQALTAARASCAAIVLLAMAFCALYLRRQALRLPTAPADPAMGRLFGWIVAVEWIGCFAIWAVLGYLHIPVYGISATVGIVGLHFLPLGRLFRYPPHYVTGAVMTLWATYSAIWVPEGQMQSVAALGAGGILWLGAAATLVLAVYAMNRRARAVSELTCPLRVQ